MESSLNPTVSTRHCNCVYYDDWHRTTRPKPAIEGAVLPNVSKAVTIPKPSDTTQLPPRVLSLQSTTSSSSGPSQDYQSSQAQSQSQSGLPFDEEAKLVFGVVLSLRNMIKKLSGKWVNVCTSGQPFRASSPPRLFLGMKNFTSYKTSTYRLHLYETLSGYKFILLSDPNTDSMRFVLRQIYSGPFVEYVARNPLVDMDSREHGIDNEHFRNATDRLIRTLSVFQ